jgi:hypothetical protein
MQVAAYFYSCVVVAAPVVPAVVAPAVVVPAVVVPAVVVPTPVVAVPVEEAPSIMVESADISVVVSVLISVVVVSVVAGFDSQEVRAAANTKARADTFRRFFILMLGLESCLKTSFISAEVEGNPRAENIFWEGYYVALSVLTTKANG